MRYGIYLEDAVEAVRGLIPDADGKNAQKLTDAEKSQAYLVYAPRLTYGYIAYRDHEGVKIFRGRDGVPLKIIFAYQCKESFGGFVDIETPSGWNVIDLFRQGKPLFRNFYKDLSVDLNNYVTITREDGRRNRVYTDYQNIDTFDENNNLVFSEWCDRSLDGILKQECGSRTVVSDNEGNAFRLAALYGDGGIALIDGTGRVVAEGISDYFRILYTFGHLIAGYKVQRTTEDGGKEFNFLYFDFNEKKYKLAFEKWGSKISNKCYPFDKPMPSGHTMITVFYSQEEFSIFNATEQEGLMGGAVFDDYGAFVIDLVVRVAAYRVKGDGRSIIVYNGNEVFAKDEASRKAGVPMLFDRVEADYENQFVRGYVGNDAYLYDIKHFDTQCNKAPRKESDVVFCHGNAAVYMEGGTKKYAVNADRSNDKMDYYDDIVVMPHENGDVCMYGYDKDDDNYRQIIMLT